MKKPLLFKALAAMPEKMPKAAKAIVALSIPLQLSAAMAGAYIGLSVAAAPLAAIGLGIAGFLVGNLIGSIPGGIAFCTLALRRYKEAQKTPSVSAAPAMRATGPVKVIRFGLKKGFEVVNQDAAQKASPPSSRKNALRFRR